MPDRSSSCITSVRVPAITKYIAGRYSPAPRPALMRAAEAADAASAALVVSFTEYAEHAAHSSLGLARAAALNRSNATASRGGSRGGARSIAAAGAGGTMAATQLRAPPNATGSFPAVTDSPGETQERVLDVGGGESGHALT